VVNIQKKCSEFGVKLGQRQGSLAADSAGRSITIQLAQEHLVHGCEEALNAATAAWLAGNGKHQPDFQVRAHLFESWDVKSLPLSV
jgi:hypothetical protein